MGHNVCDGIRCQSRIPIGWRSLGPLCWLEMQAGTTLTTSDKEELNQDDGVGFALSRGIWAKHFSPPESSSKFKLSTEFRSLRSSLLYLEAED